MRFHGDVVMLVGGREQVREARVLAERAPAVLEVRAELVADALPSSNERTSWTSQRVPTRHGVHLPHDSCM